VRAPGCTILRQHPLVVVDDGHRIVIANAREGLRHRWRQAATEDRRDDIGVDRADDVVESLRAVALPVDRGHLPGSVVAERCDGRAAETKGDPARFEASDELMSPITRPAHEIMPRRGRGVLPRVPTLPE